VLDLNELALRTFGVDSGRPARVSLASLCDELLDRELPKPKEVRCSNWEAAPLSEEQLRYAATDAWAGFLCFRNIFARDPVVAAKAAIPQERVDPECKLVRKRSLPSADCPSEMVSAMASCRDLPPSKREVYRLFSENKLTAKSIAELRGIQVSTVLGYLTDAVAAGYSYDLADFGVTFEDRAAIDVALTAAESASGNGGSGNLKVVKDALPDHIGYWAIKLMQVHRARTSAKSAADAVPDKNERQSSKPDSCEEKTNDPPGEVAE